MGKKLQIKIDSLDLGQILEGLRSRQESWKNTAVFSRDGFFPDEAFVCEECSDADEAERIADDYRRIIGNIERQIDAQGS
jgi:hypothetical protein